ncbi:glycerate kinase type-2 family protein [Bythopirellula polymerisocia]|uniref:Putative hydroxypyruvate reductase n=1 Tax=Bythopirellula polymerisocia TaxID=2528003 RepID=A0A5C6CQN4_9BACT|nr:DUF4147 domain-containing protein [Bythopirellula polymerisocia]TWU25844.1 putative hydroxypyruvate reductase [Bythopirellula polymerisocia]
MKRQAAKLRDDALRIWHAGVAAVQPSTLIPDYVAVEGRTLLLGNQEFDLGSINNIAVVGAGKAGASLAVALEKALGDQVLHEKNVAGWVNIPDETLLPAKSIHLHQARPTGVNEPREAGAFGTERILEIVADLGPDDLCICLLTGGGSALLPAPIQGLSLAEKCELIREISASGGNIHQLNAVRRELSRVKGGGLARACRAGQLVTLILSDVLGDDLETIASGPTVLRKSTPDLAIQVLHDLGVQDQPAAQKAILLLEKKEKLAPSSDVTHQCSVSNIVIGNNATAVDGAGCEAERLGYSHAMISASESEGSAEQVAAHVATMALSMRGQEGPDCLISGGEPTVKLCPSSERGLGGRNQQLALAMLDAIADWRGLSLVAGGTDGEDGPTDAAGAIVDEEIAERANKLGLEPAEFLRRNDAYHFFEAVGGLLKTGPTQTNVCDLRVVTVARQGTSGC